MRAAIFNGPHSITVGERPNPTIEEPAEAIVRVVLRCVCGSDLWYYRGESPHPIGSIGHEFIGVVEEIGSEVHGVTPGDLVVAPFVYSDMACPLCQAGVTSHCVAGGSLGNGTVDGGQCERVRVPLAQAAAEVMRDAGSEVGTATLDVSSRESAHALVETSTALGDLTGLLHAAEVSPSQASPITIPAVDHHDPITKNKGNRPCPNR